MVGAAGFVVHGYWLLVLVVGYQPWLVVLFAINGLHLWLLPT